MTVVLLILGSVFVAAGVNGHVAELETQLKSDLLGSGDGKPGFILWLGAILFVSILTKSVDIPQAGKGLLVLLIIIFVLKNESLIAGLIAQVEALGGGGAASNASPGGAPSNAGPTPATGAK